MPAKVVVDLHSAVDALRREVAPDDPLLLLGDLINVIDYSAMDGILVEVFGVEPVRELVQLRSQGRIEEARMVLAGRRSGREEEIGEKWSRLVAQAYDDVAAALPDKTYLIGGNVDPPAMLKRLVSDGAVDADGKVFEIEGLRVGFVGGGLPTPVGVAGEIPEEEYDEKLRLMGEVDVVCSHVPPDLPELTYDTVAGRREVGSAGLLAYVKEVQPLRVYFGHIHQPLVSSTHLGRTHLVNAGFFRKTRRALRLRDPL